MADNTLPKVAETALPVAAMENVTHVRVVSTDNSEKLPINNLTIAGTKVTVAVDGLSGTVDGAFGDVLTAIAEKADTTQVEALADADKANYAKSVEMIAHDAEAPSPVIPTGTTKTYEFSSGGSCSWITGGAVTVEKGDKVEVAFTAPSTFVRTYQDVVSKKENAANKETTLTDSDTKFPTSKAVNEALYRSFGIFNNNELNSIIKELYIPVSALPELNVVTMIRVYNGYGNVRGCAFYNSSNTVVLDLRYNIADTNPFIKKGLSACIIKESVIGVDYKDYNGCIISEIVRNMYYMPTIYTLLTVATNPVLNSNKATISEDNVTGFQYFQAIIEQENKKSGFLNEITADKILLGQGLIYNSLGMVSNSSSYYSITKIPCRGFKNVYFKDLSNNPVVVLALRRWNDAGVMSTVTDVSQSDISSYAQISVVVDNSVDPTTLRMVFDKGTQDIDVIQDKVINLENKILKAYPVGMPYNYQGDTKKASNFLVNSVAYPDGTIIGCRNGGDVVKIEQDGTESVLLSITGASDWRLMFIDKNLNVYVSPHASVRGSISASVRGLYRLEYGQTTFVKVINLEDGTSNDDTIWTMTEDKDGNLYAGVYAHTVRPNADIWKSTDGGNTWSVIFDFLTVVPAGRHIHCIYYCPWQKALYCLVGEINTVWKSIDGGATWVDLNIVLTVKGTMITSTPYCRIIGSDDAYACEIDITTDDVTHKTVYSGAASTVFAFRTSDITGFIYAFCKIDSSVNVLSYYPPIGALSDENILTDWINTNPYNLSLWQDYNAKMTLDNPLDAIRPQHVRILISKDGGFTWEEAYKEFTGSAKAYGFWTTGQFLNGELLTGRVIDVLGSMNYSNPIVISEGRKKYGAGGIDLSGDIFNVINI